MKITDMNFVVARTPPNSSTKQILWMYGHGLTQCDCGKDLMISQAFYNGVYEGKCICGKILKYKNGKFTVLIIKI